MEDQQITLAHAAYDRYGAVTDYKNFQGNPMPKWEELPTKIQEAWVAAANPVLTDDELANIFSDDVMNTLGIYVRNMDSAGMMLCADNLRDKLTRYINSFSSSI